MDRTSSLSCLSLNLRLNFKQFFFYYYLTRADNKKSLFLYSEECAG